MFQCSRLMLRAADGEQFFEWDDFVVRAESSYSANIFFWGGNYALTQIRGCCQQLYVLRT